MMNSSSVQVALIGHQAPGFTDFHPNPFLMSQTFGAVFQHVGLTEYIQTALETITEEEVAKDVEVVIKELKFPLKALDTGFEPIRRWYNNALTNQVWS